MVAKYGNIIPFMETQINGICCEASRNGLNELGFLCHMLVTVMTLANALGL